MQKLLEPLFGSTSAFQRKISRFSHLCQSMTKSSRTLSPGSRETWTTLQAARNTSAIPLAFTNLDALKSRVLNNSVKGWENKELTIQEQVAVLHAGTWLSNILTK